MSLVKQRLIIRIIWTLLSGRKGEPANGVFEKWDKQDIQKITDSATQPASSSHPQPHQYKGQRFSRGRGISRNALWLGPYSFLSIQGPFSSAVP